MTLAIGQRARFVLARHPSFGEVVVIRGLEAAWEGGPPWPYYFVPEHKLRVLAAPEWLEPTTRAPGQDIEQLPLFGGTQDGGGTGAVGRAKPAGAATRR